MRKKENAGRKPEIREIGAPQAITHGYHVEYDPVTTTFTGVPAGWTHVLPEGLARPRDEAQAQQIPAHLQPSPTSDMSARRRGRSDAALSPDPRAAQHGIIGKPFNVRRVCEGSEVRIEKPVGVGWRALRTPLDAMQRDRLASQRTCDVQTSTRPDIMLPPTTSIGEANPAEPFRYTRLGLARRRVECICRHGVVVDVLVDVRRQTLNAAGLSVRSL
jgi:hypothetical protein